MGKYGNWLLYLNEQLKYVVVNYKLWDQDIFANTKARQKNKQDEKWRFYVTVTGSQKP